MAFQQTIRLAGSNNDSLGNNIPVNSTSYIHHSSVDFRWDGTVQPLTHFRIYSAGQTNAASQSVTMQLSKAASPGTPLSSGGNDAVMTTNSFQELDSGWIALATPLITDELLSVAFKGNNSTVDFQCYHLSVSVKYTP